MENVYSEYFPFFFIIILVRCILCILSWLCPSSTQQLTFFSCGAIWCTGGQFTLCMRLCLNFTMSDVQQLFLPNARHMKADFGDELRNRSQHTAYLALMLMCICLHMTTLILLRVMNNRSLLTQATHSGQTVCTNGFLHL